MAAERSGRGPPLRREIAASARRVQLVVVLGLTIVGASAALAGVDGSRAVLAAATLVVLVPATLVSLHALGRRRPGVDLVAVVAMAGALLLGEELAGAIIAVMLTGGEALEDHAAGRARRELTRLLGREPRTAHVLREADLQDVDVDDLVPGDLVVVKRGEVIPADGVLVDERAVLDLSALTGEVHPVTVTDRAPVVSGALNAGPAMRVRVSAPAADSTYRGIVRLVEQAATERAPFVRMADRFAGVFVVATAALALLAWSVSGDPVRALAVLVVATPCPLILAAPAAIVGGLSNAARRGIIVKGGAAIEALAAGRVVLLDKTGTVTTGRPVVTRTTALSPGDDHEALRFAASLDQASVHPFAPAIVEAARERSSALAFPTDVHETLGAGITGLVGSTEVAVGQLSFVAPGVEPDAPLRRLQRRSALEGTSLVYVALDGVLRAAITLHDPLRRDAAGAIRTLRRAGIEHVLLVTGDRLEVAEPVAESLGIDEVLADRRPEDKVAAARQARQLGPTIMVGDGINDAPALATADVGVALGTRGATAASETADVVLTTGELRSLPEAIAIAQRTRRIAWQSVAVGMGLSVVAMVVAAAGHLPPVAGALLQEAIDVAVIVNALRAVGQGASRRRRRATPPVPERVLREHRRLAAELDDLSALAERLPDLPPQLATEELRAVRAVLVDARLPHDLEEEATVYAAVRPSGDAHDPAAPLARSRREISRRIRRLARSIDSLPSDGPAAEDVVELQRSLWGLHALLEVHDLIEDELHEELALTATSGRGRARGPDRRRSERGRGPAGPPPAGANPRGRSRGPAPRSARLG